MPAFAGLKLAEYSGGIGLFAAIQSEGFEKQFSKSNICQPGFFQIDEEGQVIELGTLSALVSGDARRKQSNAKSHGAKERGEGAVQFVAKSATTFVHYFADNGFFVENNHATGRDIEILERNGGQMRAMEGAECVGGGSRRTVVGNAIEIGGDVQHTAWSNEP